MTDAPCLDAVLAQLLAIAEAEPAREVCGFVLEGAGGGRPEILALHNASEEPERAFRVAPGDVLHVLRMVERERRGLAALYHSHPSGGSSLSPRDLADLTIDGAPLLPGVELWVVGMDAGKAVEVRAHRWLHPGGFTEIARRRAPFTV